MFIEFFGGKGGGGTKTLKTIVTNMKYQLKIVYVTAID